MTDNAARARECVHGWWGVPSEIVAAITAALDALTREHEAALSAAREAGYDAGVKSQERRLTEQIRLRDLAIELGAAARLDGWLAAREECARVADAAALKAEGLFDGRFSVRSVARSASQQIAASLRALQPPVEPLSRAPEEEPENA